MLVLDLNLKDACRSGLISVAGSFSSAIHAGTVPAAACLRRRHRALPSERHGVTQPAPRSPPDIHLTYPLRPQRTPSALAPAEASPTDASTTGAIWFPCRRMNRTNSRRRDAAEDVGPGATRRGRARRRRRKETRWGGRGRSGDAGAGEGRRDGTHGKAAIAAGIAVAGTGDWRAVGEEEESSRAGEGRRDGTQGRRLSPRTSQLRGPETGEPSGRKKKALDAEIFTGTVTHGWSESEP